MHSPEVSVVLPIRDDAHVLPLTLGSLAAQTLEPDRWEVVLVDDGSAVPAAATAERAGLANLRVVRHERSRGRSAARNSGIAAARGEVVVLLDGDSYTAPDLIERHRAFHLDGDGPERVMLGGRYEPSWETLDRLMAGDPAPPTSQEQLDLRLSMFGVDEATFAAVGAPWAFVFTHNMSVRRSTLEAIGGFDEEFDGWGHEDVELGFRLHANAGRRPDYFALEPSAYCFHVPHYRNSAVQGVQARANLELFRRRHPRYDAELYGGPRRLLAANVARYDKVVEAFRESRLGVVDAAWLAGTVAESASLLLVGGMAAPERPGRTVVFDHRSEADEGNRHLFGHRTPFAELEFDSVVHIDLWQYLSVNELAGVVNEGLRIGRRLSLVSTDAPRPGVLGSHCSVDYLLAMLADRFSITEERTGSARAVTLEKPS